MGKHKVTTFRVKVCQACLHDEREMFQYDAPDRGVHCWACGANNVAVAPFSYEVWKRRPGAFRLPYVGWTFVPQFVTRRDLRLIEYLSKPKRTRNTTKRGAS